MLMREPFYASFSRHIDKRVDESMPYAMSISYEGENRNYILRYNPDLCQHFSDQQLFAVLQHEFLHLILGHINHQRTLELTKRWNYAFDLAINTNLTNLPPRAIIPGHGLFRHLKPNKAAEWYYFHLEDEELLENIEFGHDWNGPTNDMDMEIAQNKLDRAIHNAVVDAKNHWGNTSYRLQKYFLSLVESKISWKKDLHWFVQRTQRAGHRSSIRRINKKYPYIYAGRQTIRHPRLAVAIDQSGSVNDNLLKVFFGALKKLTRESQVFVFYFDTEVDQDSAQWINSFNNLKLQRKLGGGTNFDAPTKYINNNTNKERFDGLLIFTDLMAPAPCACKLQRGWVVPKSLRNQITFQPTEKVIWIDTG